MVLSNFPQMRIFEVGTLEGMEARLSPSEISSIVTLPSCQTDMLMLMFGLEAVSWKNA
jgi:hypothetical protein